MLLRGLVTLIYRCLKQDKISYSIKGVQLFNLNNLYSQLLLSSALWSDHHLQTFSTVWFPNMATRSLDINSNCTQFSVMSGLQDVTCS